MNKIKFTWDLAFGHVVQIATFVFAAIALYLGVVTNIQKNTTAISINKHTIEQVKERMHDDMKEVKGDLDFLVKLQIQRGGTE